MFYTFHYFFFFTGLAVLAESLKAFAVGAPLAPTFLIFSPDPAAILFFFAAIFAYSPDFICHTPTFL